MCVVHLSGQNELDVCAYLHVYFEPPVGIIRYFVMLLLTVYLTLAALPGSAQSWQGRPGPERRMPS